MTHDDHVKIARAVIALHHVPATNEVVRAVTGLESLLPLSGTPEARAVWADAHGVGAA